MTDGAGGGDEWRWCDGCAGFSFPFARKMRGFVAVDEVVRWEGPLNVPVSCNEMISLSESRCLRLVEKVVCLVAPGFPLDLTLWDAVDVKGKRADYGRQW